MSELVASLSVEISAVKNTFRLRRYSAALDSNIGCPVCRGIARLRVGFCIGCLLRSGLECADTVAHRIQENPRDWEDGTRLTSS
jgi:hypothetical protein